MWDCLNKEKHQRSWILFIQCVHLVSVKGRGNYIEGKSRKKVKLQFLLTSVLRELYLLPTSLSIEFKANVNLH